MTNVRTRIFAILWLVIFVVVAAIAFVRLTPETIRTDIEDLLPEQTLETRAGEVLSHIVKSSAQDVWILISHPDRIQAQKALECFSDNLKKAGLTPADPARNFEPSTLQKALFPFRENFLTDKDRAWLENADDKALLSRAMRILYRPLAPNSWRAVDDPLGLFENWLSSQSSAERFTYIDGRTAVTDDSKRLWFVLQLKSKDVVAAVDGQKITMALAQAEAAARAKTDDKLKVLSAGIPLISEEVAHQAASEASFIGTISTLGIAALVLVFFARLIPLLQTLVVLTLAVTFAFSCVVAIFGEIHVVTIVFGATLLGVCVDYVFHLLCATSNGLTGMEASQRLLRPLTASLLSTIAGYLIMLITPMPGLRQISIFCVAGLMCTFAVVMLWMAPRVGALRASRFSNGFAVFFAKIPSLDSGRSKAFLLTLVFAAAAGGLIQLSTTNELRLISGVDKALLAKQSEVNNILNPASPAQFFVVEGSSGCDVLSRIAALKTRLDALDVSGIKMLSSSRFLESCEKQQDNQRLAHRANVRALELLSTAANEKIDYSAPSGDILSVQIWQKAVPEALSRTWISSRQALVLLTGVTQDNVSELPKAADGLRNVSFVDTSAGIALSLAYFRDRVLEVLCWATGLVGVVLVVVFRRSFLRLWTPCIAGIALTLGTLGWLNIPLSLFSVLPLILVLGLGVDYAILLNDEKSTTSAGNSVFLAAASTLLAFGLLAFSSTPALHIFGLTLAIALGWVLVLTIALRTRR